MNEVIQEANRAMRASIVCLSDEEIATELTRPTGNWDTDIEREALRRLLLWMIASISMGTTTKPLLSLPTIK